MCVCGGGGGRRKERKQNIKSVVIVLFVDSSLNVDVITKGST